jgi:dTDP-4-amino-4,6-dideoxygalactose transaminase
VESARLAIDGGDPVRTRPWPTSDKGDVLVDEQDERAALRAVRSGLLHRYDYRDIHETEVGRFEAKLRERFGVDHALAVSGGTAALTVALLAVGVEQGDEVACPAFTFAATPSAIVLAGARPVVIDIDENLNMDPADLARKAGPAMKAVIGVHMRGLACDIRALGAVAGDHGMRVVEDNAAACGVTLGGRPLGTFGDAGAFSMQSDKTLNTGEGGFLLFSDEETYARALVLSGAYKKCLAKHYPDDPPPVSAFDLPLLGLRLDEIRGAIASSQLDKLDDRLRDQRAVYDAVIARLRDIDEIAIRTPVEPDAVLGEALVFRLPGVSEEYASWFARAVSAEGVDARAFGSRGDTNHRSWRNWRFIHGDEDEETVTAMAPNADRYLAEAIDIPLVATLTEADCDDLAAAVRKVIAARPPAA